MSYGNVYSQYSPAMILHGVQELQVLFLFYVQTMATVNNIFASLLQGHSNNDFP